MSDVQLLRFLREFYALKHRLRLLTLATLLFADLLVLLFVANPWRLVLIAGFGVLALVAGRLIHGLQPPHRVSTVARELAERLSRPLH